MINHNILSMSYEEIIEQISSNENISSVINIINKMTKDEVYGDYLISLLKNNKPETRSFVFWLASQIKPKTYLEVGTRRGWSLAMVASAAPNCKIYSFDEWHEGYGGVDNPGPTFILNELNTLGCNNEIDFVSGNSHVTLREFFQTNPDKKLDMILIDGDHSVEGAYQDLKDTIEYLNVGGAIIFDDIVDCEGLLGVWDAIKREHSNFRYITYQDSKPGVGFAIKIF